MLYFETSEQAQSRIGPGLQAVIRGGAPALAAIGRTAIEGGLPSYSIGLFAAAKPAALALRDDIARGFPLYDDPAELFEDDAVGRPRDAMLAHSRFDRIVCGADIRRAASEFTALIALMGGFTLERHRIFLARRRREIEDGIHLDIACRAKGEPLPRIAWLHEAADHYRNYKARFGLVDGHDLEAAAFWPDRAIRLLLLDDVTDKERDRLMQIYPNSAAIIHSPSDSWRPGLL